MLTLLPLSALKSKIPSHVSIVQVLYFLVLVLSLNAQHHTKIPYKLKPRYPRTFLCAVQYLQTAKTS